MKRLLILIFLFYCTIKVNAQDENAYGQIDRVALNIPASQTNTTADIADYIQKHFNKDGEKIRAAYTWVITNIKYDKDSIHRVILDEGRDQKVTFALRRRKGICENFAAIFNDICIKVGIRSFVIDGYTKQNGALFKEPHAWCAAFVNNNWFLFDPTWDAGFAGNGGPIKTSYFQLSPADFIQTHLPYDPLFQFLNYPLSYKKIIGGNITDHRGKPYFNYMDSISEYEKSDSLTRYLGAFSRIKANGWPAAMIDTKLKQIKLEIELIYQDEDMANYNSAVDNYNSAIGILNDFLNYRNNQFKPMKSNDEVRKMFIDISKLVSSANLKLKDVNSSKASLSLDTGDLQKKLNDLISDVKEQENFFTNNWSGMKN